MLAPWMLQRSSSHASARELEGMEACKDLYIWVILPGVIAHVTVVQVVVLQFGSLNPSSSQPTPHPAGIELVLSVNFKSTVRSYGREREPKDWQTWSEVRHPEVTQSS